MDLDDERYDVIRAAGHVEHRVCLPEMVLEELVAQRVLSYRGRHPRVE
ncbi:hypothetical protein [Embleya sp. NPDC020630]